MPYGVKLHVWGDYACFTRPEMKVERVSYDVMTPSAARGILEAIHWKPAIRWLIDRIHVLKPIRFETLRRNELRNKIPSGKVRIAMRRKTTMGLRAVIEDERQQRFATLLRDVGYVIEAHFVLTDKASEGDTAEKHFSIFSRRASKGQCFHRPYFGVREFAANFALIQGEMPSSDLSPNEQNRDLGWMLHDLDYRGGMTPHFFHAELRDGSIIVPSLDSEKVKA